MKEAEARAALEQALDALMWQPRTGVDSWDPTVDAYRETVKRIIYAALKKPAGTLALTLDAGGGMVQTLDARDLLKHALNALMLQPETGPSSWIPAVASRRVAAKRAIKRLLV